MDTLDLAVDAGLHYVESGAPGYRRVRHGRGFSYRAESSRPVGESKREWIESLAIPPAWEDVWIAKDPRGHILATGLDRAGRKQYIYHPDWERIRDEVKFDRLGDFGERLPELRKRVDADLRIRGMSRDRIIALAVAVLDRTLVRVGNRRYSDQNESYGLTTLTCDHIQVDGSHVHLEFAGKGGSDRQVVLSDRRLSSLVSRCQELSGQTL
ncbi:MAG: DNA topoisomerase IB, partial [Acidimicrobiia bacterium]